MTLFVDARVPIRFGCVEDAGPHAALLIEGAAEMSELRPLARFVLPAAVPAHAAGCVCYAPRGPAADALAGLFLARGRGEVAWFGAVLAVAGEAGRRAVRDAVASDPRVSAWFRLDEPDRLSYTE